MVQVPVHFVSLNPKEKVMYKKPPWRYHTQVSYMN